MTKYSFVYVAFVAVVGMGTVGCGGDDCEDGADRIQAKFKECGNAVEPAAAKDADLECTEKRAAEAQRSAACYEAAKCPAVRNEDVAGAVTLGECLAR